MSKSPGDRPAGARQLADPLTVREVVRANLRVLAKRVVREHGCPPDKHEKATQALPEQAEDLSGFGHRRDQGT